MSFDGQVLWKRMLAAPCALTTLGAATAAAVVAPAAIRNLRRVAVLESGLLLMSQVPPRASMGRADRGPVVFTNLQRQRLIPPGEAIVLPALLCFTRAWGSRKAPNEPIFEKIGGPNGPR